MAFGNKSNTAGSVTMKLLLIYAVEAIRLQGQIFSNPVIENPKPPRMIV